MKESYFIIKYKYDMRVYSLEYMCKLVEEKIISKNDFHFITSYDYDGIKEMESIN